MVTDCDTELVGDEVREKVGDGLLVTDRVWLKLAESDRAPVGDTDWLVEGESD